MYRRLISSCVLAGFVIAQWAAMPHGHALGSQLPDDHAAIPHVHLAGIGVSSHKHEHGHEHATSHAHHHDAARADRQGMSHDCRLSDIGEHDEDAVYLPTSGSIATTSGADQSKQLTAHALLIFVDGTPSFDAIVACHVASLRPPAESAPGCALYLALRALRI